MGNAMLPESIYVRFRSGFESSNLIAASVKRRISQGARQHRCLRLTRRFCVNFLPLQQSSLFAICFGRAQQNGGFQRQESAFQAPQAFLTVAWMPLSWTTK